MLHFTHASAPGGPVSTRSSVLLSWDPATGTLLLPPPGARCTIRARQREKSQKVGQLTSFCARKHRLVTYRHVYIYMYIYTHVYTKRHNNER